MLTAEILNENHHLDIPDHVIDNEVYNLVKDIEAKPGFDPSVQFDPKRHLKFANKNLNKIKLTDLNITKTHVKPISEIGAVEPFELFTDEAIDLMKYEVFSNTALLKKYGRVTATGHNATATDFQLSGFSDDAPFCRAAWTHPETVKIFSDLMGIEFYLPHPFNISHINASLTPRKRGEPPAQDSPEEYEELKRKQDENPDNISANVGWHYDSPPFVCVCMLSAPSNMIGGETGLRDGNENIVRIADPKPGQVSLLQARVIKHIATKPLNRCDRISYVISLLPKDPDMYDSSQAVSERPGASSAFTNDRFYPNFINYRMDRVKARLDRYQKKIMDNYKEGRKFSQNDAIDFLLEIEEYVHNTYKHFEAISDEPYPPKWFSTPYKDL